MTRSAVPPVAPGRVRCISIHFIMSPEPGSPKPLVANEGIKAASHHLRGSLAADFANTSTGEMAKENDPLTKFHGLYNQDDRDLRAARKKEGKEKAFGF